MGGVVGVGRGGGGALVCRIQRDQSVCSQIQRPVVGEGPSLAMHWRLMESPRRRSSERTRQRANASARHLEPSAVDLNIFSIKQRKKAEAVKQMKLMWRRPSAAGLSEGNEAVCRFALSGASCTPDAPAGSSANTA